MFLSLLNTERNQDRNKQGAAALHFTECVIAEPLRHLTFILLHHSWLPDRSKDPFICDLLWRPASLPFHCAQYLSSMLAGQVRRLVLVWRVSGCNSLKGWIHTFPDQARRLRRSIFVEVGGQKETRNNRSGT